MPFWSYRSTSAHLKKVSQQLNKAIKKDIFSTIYQFNFHHFLNAGHPDLFPTLPHSLTSFLISEVGIYKRKQESKKKERTFFFLVAFLVEFLFSCFLTFLFSLLNSHLCTYYVVSDIKTIHGWCFFNWQVNVQFCIRWDYE